MTVSCDFCSYQGKNQSTTDHHIKAVHEKVKRYHCDLCDYGAYFRQNFRAHQKNKHGSTVKENPKNRNRKLISKTNSKKKGKVTRFNCALCDFGTLYKQNLDRHINIKHSTNADTESVIRLEVPKKSQILSCFVTFITSWKTFIGLPNYNLSKSL